MSLTMSSLTCSCICSDILKILQLLTHDLRDTRDKRVRSRAPQPIGFAVLRLTCSSAGSRLMLPQSSALITAGMLEMMMNVQHAHSTLCWMHDAPGLGAGAARER